MAKVRILEFDIPLPLDQIQGAVMQYWRDAPFHPKVMEEEHLPGGKKMSVHVKACFAIPADSLFEIEMTRQDGGTHFYVEVCFIQGAFSRASTSWLAAQGYFQDLCKFLGYPQLLPVLGDTFDLKI